MKRIGVFVGLWWCIASLWGQADIRSYKLEVKLSAENQRIAGTCLVKIRPQQHLERWDMFLSDSLRVVRAYLDGEPVDFQQANGTVQVIFRPAIRRNEDHNIALIYGGPVGDVANRNDIWQVAQDGSHLIQLDAKTVQPYNWFPVPTQSDASLDSMRFAVIFDKAYNPLVSGKLKSVKKLPGSFYRWEYALPAGTSPEDMTLYIGNFRVKKEVLSGESGFGEFKFILSPAATSSPQAALKQVVQAARVYETYFGPIPVPEGGIQWMQVEPWMLSSRGMVDFGMPDDWPERLAAYWWGQSVRPADAAASQLLEGLCTYSKGVLLGAWQDFETGALWALDTTRTDFDPAAATWHMLQTLTDNDYTWWDAVKGFHTQYAKEEVSRADIISYFSWKLDIDCEPIFGQYLDAAQAPILEYKRERKGKRLLCAFRWSSPVPNFSMSIPWTIDGETEYIRVTDDWLRFERKGLKPAEVEPDVSRLWITLRPLK